MLTALIAFLAGVAAVSVKGWIDYALEERRERKALRAGARLVSAEIRSASVYLKMLSEKQEDDYGWWPKEQSPFLTPAWDEYAYLLAGAAGPFEWGYIQSARTTLTSVEASYQRATEGGTKFGPPLTESERAFVGVHGDTLKMATEKLSKIEDAPLPFEGLKRLWWSVRHPIRAVKLWRTNRAYRKKKAASKRASQQ